MWSKLTLGTFGPLPLLALPLKIHLFKANTHWHIIGTSGSGKSFFLAHLFFSLLKQGSPVRLIGPHGDLAKLVLTHLVAQGRYKDTTTYEQILYLDLPAGEQQGRFLPFNPLLQDIPAHTIASNFKEAMHRAFPELSHEHFRTQLLARLTTQDAAITTNYFHNVYAELRRAGQCF